MSPQTLVRRRRSLAGFAATALTASALALVPSPAQATELPTHPVTIADGSIQWGLKDSFRSYLTGIPSVGGTITATTPATDPGTATGVTTFPEATGAFATNKAATVSTQGSVNYTGHNGVLDLTISDPKLVVTASTATLVVDAVDSDDVTHDDLAIGSVDLAGKATKSGTTVTITNAPVTLLASGEALFSYDGAPMYTAGAELSPLNATLTTLAAPSVQVSRTVFYEDETATITVTGAGFDPYAATGSRPPLLGQNAGTYVVFGKFADNWRPSAGATGTARKNTSQKWAVPEAALATVGTTEGVTLTPDGTFTAQLTVSKATIDAATESDPSLKNYGIYTYPGSGATQAAYETYTPVSFVDEPTVTVAETTFGAHETAVVTVQGTGFLPEMATGTRPPLMNQQAGTYVVFGKFADNWRPSAGAGTDTRKNTSQKWAVPAAALPRVGSAEGVLLNPDGSFTADVTVSKKAIDAATASTPALSNYGIYTYPGSGASQAGYETYTPITFTKTQAPAITMTDGTQELRAPGTFTVTAPVAGTVSVEGFAPQTATAAGQVLTFNVPARNSLETTTHAVSLAPTDPDYIAPADTTVTITVTKIQAPAITVTDGTQELRAPGTFTVTAPVAGTVSVEGFDPQTATEAGQVLTFNVPARNSLGTTTHAVSLVPTDPDYIAPADTTVSVTVTKIQAPAITVSDLTAPYGVGGTFTVTAPVAGTVTVEGFDPQTATEAGQVLTFTVPATRAAGSTTHAVSIVPTDTDYLAPADTTVSVTITKIASPTLKGSGLTTSYGKGGVLKVTAPSAGQVTVAGIGAQNATAANQVLSFNLAKAQKVGKANFKVSFVPSDANVSAPAPISLTVKVTKAAAGAAKVKVTKKPTTKKAGKATVTVTGVSGAKAATGKVQVMLTKGKAKKVVTGTLKNGKVSIKLPKRAKGTWKIQVRYLGDANYTPRGYLNRGKVKVTK